MGMTKKRFEINNLVKKGNMSFWDNESKTILNASHTLDLLNELSEKNNELKKDLFETRKDYLIETADISDKLYLDEMIENERKEIFK